MEERTLDFAGIGNARELGGCRIGEHSVKRGVLIRTASLGHATKEDLEKLQNTYRIRQYVDLRMDSELKGQPDPEITDAEYLHIPIFETADMLVEIDPELVARYAGNNLDRMELFELSYEEGFLGTDLYVRFLLEERGRKGWKLFFEKLLATQEEGGFLWHCTDGKDRTGCGAMLILSALGADRETIMGDYLYTNIQNRERLDLVRRKIEPMKMPKEKLEAMIFFSGGVSESYLGTAIDALVQNYGSVTGYLSTIGVGQPELEELRRRYLV